MSTRKEIESIKGEKVDIGIINNLNAFKSDNFIDCYDETNRNTRFKSWEWCHLAILEGKKEYNKDITNKDRDLIIDFLSLHLAFYLASWGMLRNSFILQRDYKCHKIAVKYILDPMYDSLWDFNPSDITEDKIKEIYNLIFDKDNGIYFKIKNSYKENNNSNDIPTHTLVTKILLGTFACIPAFDELLIDAITYCKDYSENKDAFNNLNTNIEKYTQNDFFQLCKFANKNKNELIVKSNIDENSFNYPIMRCIDAYFWEIGLKIGKLIKNKKTKK